MAALTSDGLRDAETRVTDATLVVEIARLLTPEELARLATGHQDDGHGRCTGCRLPQAGNQAWPCTIYNVSIAALDIRTGRAAVAARSARESVIAG